MRAAVLLIMLGGLCAAPLAGAQIAPVSGPISAPVSAPVGAPVVAQIRVPASADQARVADAATGDVTRGAAIVASRSTSFCVLCHAVPGVPASQQGSLAPPLAGAGARWSADQLRERLVAPERFNPDTLMPSFRRSSGFTRVAPARQGQALFDAQQLEDVVAYLATLR